MRVLIDEELFSTDNLHKCTDRKIQKNLLLNQYLTILNSIQFTN